jgi:hypothetical protein
MRGGVQAYGDRAAHLQCLPHEGLRALTHHHHARRAHGHGSGGVEHGGYVVAAVEWRVCGSSSSSWVEALSQEQLLELVYARRRVLGRKSPHR